MAMSLRDQLAARPDLKEKTVELQSTAMNGTPPVTATIRRVTVGERKQLVAKSGLNTDKPDNVAFGIELVSISLVPPVPIDEVMDMPAAVIDELSALITDFNGWSRKEQAALADSFRATA